jgi:hypothetical protein
MRRACFTLLVAGSTVSPTVAAEHRTVTELYATCIRDGLEAHEYTLKLGSFVQFVCHGADAQEFYDALGRYGFEATEEMVGGAKVLSRNFDLPDKCWKGAGASEYACEINFHGLSALFDKEQGANAP